MAVEKRPSRKRRSEPQFPILVKRFLRAQRYNWTDKAIETFSQCMKQQMEKTISVIDTMVTGRYVYQYHVRDLFTVALSMTNKSKSVAKTETNDLLCIVCADAPRSALFWPCRHFSTCGDCAQSSMVTTRNKCPVCRVEVEHIVKIFT